MKRVERTPAWEWRTGSGDVAEAAVAEYIERQHEFRSRRVKEGRARNKIRGRHLGGTPPFGYRKIAARDGRAPLLVKDPAQQKAIAEIHRLRATGASLAAIRDKIRNSGVPISHETVRQVLLQAAGAAPCRTDRKRAGVPLVSRQRSRRALRLPLSLPRVPSIRRGY